jgi:alkylation response protein AidB-like acyl-CoA dehydrogenase
MGAVETAQRLADELLVPAAVDTDRADVMPRELLDELAAAGLYVVAVQEALASGCLTTAFVWAQHLGLVHALAVAPAGAVRARWLEPLCRGEARAGLALGGALPEPTLNAREVGDGWCSTASRRSSRGGD